MSLEPKANAWEVIGWQWACHLPGYAECEHSDGGFEDDYRTLYDEAKAHATANPTHLVHLEQMRRRRVLPQRFEDSKVNS